MMLQTHLNIRSRRRRDADSDFSPGFVLPPCHTTHVTLTHHWLSLVGSSSTAPTTTVRSSLVVSDWVARLDLTVGTEKEKEKSGYSNPSSLQRVLLQPSRAVQSSQPRFLRGSQNCKSQLGFFQLASIKPTKHKSQCQCGCFSNGTACPSRNRLSSSLPV
ncbi:hypothetical protein LZ32DRAFT_47130 [Colletotrichum eremochloae]|nr:hypothetical protein LZ32DRAFT_47130 [Colletotrichum eremochloae]